MAERTRPSWQTKRLQRVTLLPVFALSTVMGTRYYSRVTPGDTFLSLGSGFFDAEASFDADLYFDPGGVFLDRGDRLVGLSELDRRAQHIETEVIGSWGQAERPFARIELDNEDKHFSEIVGTEYTLDQSGKVYFAYPGLDVSDALLALNGKVSRWELSKPTFIVDVEE